MRFSFVICLLAGTISQAAEMDWIRVADDKKGFVTTSKKPFIPWGFNYDHDVKGRLLEDYWHDEWPMIEAHFKQMKELRGNVVRIHLQLGKFMTAANKPNTKELDRLNKLLELAEKTGLYLDLTGLGCYHKKDVPAWYDELDEKARWDVQAKFWVAIAERCKRSPAVFCYDLMNEPVVTGGKRKPGEWLGGAFGDKHFVQFITLDAKDRPRPDIAKAWIDHLTKAIRAVDDKHLITVGFVDWSLERPGLTSGFVPSKVSDNLDFLCVHVYPESKKMEHALETLKGFAEVGKPVVIEEFFPLKCSPKELSEFLDTSKKHAHGWISFYLGKPLDDMRKSKEFVDALMTQWIDIMQTKSPIDKK